MTRLLVVAHPAHRCRAAALFTCATLFNLFGARAAHAQPWFGWDDGAGEERYADGDLDDEDYLVARHPGVTDVHGESWVSVGAFSRQLQSGKTDVGGLVVVGLALDRLAEGNVHRLADPPDDTGRGAERPRPAPVTSAVARACVVAALGAAGLGDADGRIDAIVSRSRTSAWLPETRVRAMRLLTDASHTTTLATTDGVNYYDAIGANLVLEVRLTWRLDRLVFAGDEPTLERVRMERQEARSRLANRTLEVLFAWQRAVVDLRGAVAGSPQATEAELKRAEAEATLDVLTDGWFTSRHRSAP
ncbi:MAG TPA: hypothetical protein VKU41_05690 [Polyangiaceae bacterium]|nr:hypothetical protein [Polyangiaceae bacterium]